MTQTNSDPSPADTVGDDSRDAIERAKPSEIRHDSGRGIVLLLAVIAVLAAGYAAWRVWVIDRGDENLHTNLNRQLEALDARLGENERRSARSNELAATLRDQLAESERLRDRMREDLVALGDRSARAEALLADLARQQRGPQERMALADASLLLAQADVRLRLYGDRQGAFAAVALAEAALADAGAALSDLHAAVADVAAALAADPRPSQSTLLTELDEIAQAIEPLDLRIVRDDEASTTTSGQGWWSRQLSQLDHLVTIRREAEADTEAAPTKASVRQSLQRARLAALEQNGEALARALASARTSLLACCDSDVAVPLLARLDRLIGIQWNTSPPDLRSLRERLDNRTVIEQTAETGAGPMASQDPGSTVEDTP